MDIWGSYFGPDPYGWMHRDQHKGACLIDLLVNALLSQTNELVFND